MKKILQRTLWVIAFASIFSCSKDDSDNPGINENGGLISRYQLVILETANIELTSESYTGTFAGNSIKLSKTSEHELTFYVPENTGLGSAELNIPSLNNTRIKYEVTDVILTQSVEATLAPLVTNMKNYSNELTESPEDAPFVQNQENMMSYYDNLSNADKEKVAKFYKVNKTAIDAIFNTDYNNVQGRNTFSDINFEENRALVNKFKLSLAVGIAGGAVAVLEPSNIIKPIAIGVAVVGIKKALKYHLELIDNNINIIQVKINSILGTNNRGIMDSELKFTSNVAKTVPFSINARPISAGDSNSQQEFMKLYFKTKNGLNTFVAKINTAIEWVNTNIPLVNFSTLPQAVVANTTSVSSVDVDANIMEHLTLSVSHPNLSLESVTLQNDGLLMVKVKIIGTPSSLPVNSVFKYDYADDFSKFSGTLPFVVNSESVCGEFSDIDGNTYQSVTIGGLQQCWMQSNLKVSHYRNGDIIPQVQNAAEWANLTTGAWCYSPRNEKLYNWYAVNDPRGLAPEGWHVPTRSDFEGLSSVGGNALKLTNMQATQLGVVCGSFNDNATNQSQFSASGDDYRNATGSFNSCHYTYYWSSTKDNNQNPYVRELNDYGDGNQFPERNIFGEKYGFSIRCIKD